MSEIGYNLLSVSEKEVYRKFQAAFKSYAPSVSGSDIKRTIDIMKVLQIALGDNPNVIYFNKTQIKVSTLLIGGKQISFCGAYSLSKAKAMNIELENAVDKALQEIAFLNPLTNYDKLLCVYEYLQKNISYDENELEICCRLGKSRTPFSHNAYGALVKKQGVCDGVSAAFSLITQRMGFECAVIKGRARFRTDGFSEHAWNIVKISDRFYHVDVTWDLNQYELTKEYSYDYFFLSDEAIDIDHEWDINLIPACKYGDLAFHIKNRCYANNLSQLEEIFLRYSKSKQTVVRVKISNGISIPKPEEKYLSQLLVNIAASVHRNSSISFFWNASTRCFYGKFIE